MNEKIKVILVGESHVGKTSIITQYIQNNFSDEYIATFAQDKSIKEEVLKDGTQIKLEIWDTIGQEGYNLANKIFMKNSKIALLIYDITDRKSFDNLNKFYDLICEVNGRNNVVIGVVGNKNDLYEKRVVEEEEAKKYAKDIDSTYFETSAKDHESIENLFKEISYDFNCIRNKNIENNIKNIGDDEQLENSFKIKKNKVEKQKKNVVRKKNININFRSLNI